ncbi:MAG: inositol monophosphatase family protein [bacterium]
MHPMLHTAIRAAREAGDIIMQHAKHIDQLTIEQKTDNDFVSEVDKAAEYAIIRLIKKIYPDHAILAEESGQQLTENSDYEWIIDPLDGTTNYLYGVPQYAVSIGLRHKGRMLVGVVFDPLKDELFSAARGEGAMLNNRRLRVTNRPSMQGALLVTGIPFRAHQDLDLYLNTLRALIPDTAGIRRPGSAALDLAYVAAGRYDGYWEFSLNPWDIAAGVLLVQEAGGLVGDLQGGNQHLRCGDVLAASPKVFKEMAKRLHLPLKDYRPILFD